MKKLLKITLPILVILISAPFLLFTQFEQPEMEKTDYYQKTVKAINALPDSIVETNKLIWAGWDKQSIVPSFKVNIVGYGIRNEFESVHDSLYVKAMIFSSGDTRVLMLNYDLLFISSELKAEIEKSLAQAHLNFTAIYYTASHTHNSYGGWSGGLASKVILGGLRDDVMNLLTHQTVKAVSNAVKTTLKSTISYQKTAVPHLIKNKFDQTAYTDDLLRVLHIKNSEGQQAAIVVFSAHPTNISKKTDILSADYPGALCSKLEESKTVDFALFSIGAVGITTTANCDKPCSDTTAIDQQAFYTFEEVNQYADSLFYHVKKCIATKKPLKKSNLRIASVPLYLPQPQMRIKDEYALQPWLFNSTLGNLKATLTFLRVGEVVFVGTPVDFSGELYPYFQPICQQKSIELIITSFNGSYLGYIVPDKYYYIKQKPETRENNWCGPTGGEYFCRMINRGLERF